MKSHSTARKDSPVVNGVRVPRDLTGLKIGNLLILYPLPRVKYRVQWVCKCDCGKETIKGHESLARDKKYQKSCGCLKGKAIRNKKFEDFTGKRVGILTVLHNTRREGSANNFWLCKCDCGKTIEKRTPKLKHYKEVPSCGCLQLATVDNLITNKFKEYARAAKDRKLSFELDFETFKNLILADCEYCSIKPIRTIESSTGHSLLKYNGIDRINNDLGYIRGNVTTACYDCNHAKFTMSKYQFEEWINRLIKKRLPDILVEMRSEDVEPDPTEF